VPSWRGHFHRRTVKRVVPRGDVPQTEPGNGHRTNLPTLTFGGDGPGTSTTASAPVPLYPLLFALYPLLASPASVSGGVFTALWDANSTAVCWACQEGSPIYCISILTLGVPVWNQPFSTSESLGFTPAFRHARKACVSFGLRVRRIVDASRQASAPWAHRCPRRFPGVQPDRSRRKTRQVVADMAVMFVSQRVHEHERFSELFGPDQESSAISLPAAIHFPHLRPPWGRGSFWDLS